MSFVDLTEAARMLGVPRTSVDYWRREGMIKAIKDESAGSTGRWMLEKDDIAKFAKENPHKVKVELESFTEEQSSSRELTVLEMEDDQSKQALRMLLHQYIDTFLDQVSNSQLEEHPLVYVSIIGFPLENIDRIRACVNDAELAYEECGEMLSSKSFIAKPGEISLK